MMFARLTKTDGVYGLPVAAVHRAKSIVIGVGDEAVQHGKGIFTGPTAWTDAELNAIGYARFDEVKPGAGELGTGIVDEFANGRVTRTHTTIPDPNYLDKRKAEVVRQIKGQRDAVERAGIEWSPDIGVTTHVVQTDPEKSQPKITGRHAAMIQRGEPTVNWRMLDNVYYEITAAQFTEISLAVATHVEDCYATQAVLEALVDGAADIAELEAIDITAGWPSHYVEPGAI